MKYVWLMVSEQEQVAFKTKKDAVKWAKDQGFIYSGGFWNIPVTDETNDTGIEAGDYWLKKLRVRESGGKK